MRFVDVYTHPDGPGYTWGILKERPAYANISHNGKLPEFGDHKKFLESRPYPLWFFLLDRPGGMFEEIVGTIYLTDKREVGVAVMQDFQSKGYASHAINLLRDMFPGPMLANVAPGNEPSHELFKSLCGVVIQHTYRLP